MHSANIRQRSLCLATHRFIPSDPRQFWPCPFEAAVSTYGQSERQYRCRDFYQ